MFDDEIGFAKVLYNLFGIKCAINFMCNCHIPLYLVVKILLFK